MKKVIFSLCLGFLSLSSYALTVNNMASLAQYFTQTKDLQTEFKQIVYRNFDEQLSSGILFLKSPNKFYWDYQSPDKQKIISNGRYVFQYDIDLEQISVRGRGELIGDVALKVLSGQTPLETAFDGGQVSFANVPYSLQSLTSDADYFQLQPKRNDQGYDYLWIVFLDNTLKAIMVDAGNGQQTLILFDHLKRNQGIADDQFEFTPPPGVDVIGDYQ